MSPITDVVVIGGGATGVGVARDLAMRGVEVTLFERGEGLNAGTSGRSHGVLHSGARYAESDPDGAAECIRENRVLRDIAPGCIADTGGLFIQLEDDEPSYFEEKAVACREVGIDVEHLDVETVRDRVPDVADTVVRGIAVPDGVVYPSRLVAAAAADAVDHGAEIVTGAPVEHIDTAGEGVTVQIGSGHPRTVEATIVVNAAGPWAGKVAELAGSNLEIRPTRGVMVVVEHANIGPVLNRCRAPADGDIVVPHGEQAVLGTTSVAVDDPDSFERGDWEIERTLEECATMVPSLADVPVERTYWGLRPLYEPEEETGNRGISRDFAVIEHDNAPGLVSVVGGKLTTHRLMAEAVADRICAELGVDADCRTAEEPLPGAGDPDRLDELVAAYGAAGPADSDIVD